MKKAIVIYHSKTGITKKMGEEISDFLKINNIQPEIFSINEFKNEKLKDADYVLIGCWTSGLMLFLQHPEKIWVNFARQLPDLSGKKTGLFTTYKLATGSMFRIMKKHLKTDPGDNPIEFKSRNGHLTEIIKTDLLKFIGDSK